MSTDMNRENNSRKNHYADFDEHGHMRGDNRQQDQNDQSWKNMNRDFFRATDRGRSDYRASDNWDSRNGGNYDHPRFGARARGDMRGGTPYGEGGSTYGGGSSYGRSNYGFSGEHGPDYRDSYRNKSENVRNGYGDYIDYNSRNYGTYGGSNYSGNMDRSGSNYSNSGRANTGYDSGFDGFGGTGYGATRYNNRDIDRERSAYSNRNFGSQHRDDQQSHGRDYNTRGRGNQHDERDNRYFDR